MGTYQQAPFSPNVDMQKGRALGIQLHNELKIADSFSPAPVQQVLHMVVVVALYAASYIALLSQPGPVIWIASLILLAFASVQAGFIAHEAGHKAISRQRWLAIAIG